MKKKGKRSGEKKRSGDTGTRGRGDKERPDLSSAVALPLAASPRTSVSASQWRLFCAVELPEEIRSRAAEHIARLRLKLPEVRASWDRPEKLHITLKFFGDVEQSRVPALSEALGRAANTVVPFSLSIADAGTFPLRGPARVLWLGVHDPSSRLAHLQQSLENECFAEGFKREERTFHPHITIARLRPFAGTRSLAALHQELGFPALELTVKEIVLMRSELGPNGSRYTVLSRNPLHGV